jgi:hypothetical protein
MRLSKSGVEIEDQEVPSVLLLTTKAPSKYLLIDREDGRLYMGKRAGVDKKSWLLLSKLSIEDIQEIEEYIPSNVSIDYDN